MSAEPVGGGWQDLIVVCAARPWKRAPRLDHHLARGLHRSAPVLYVDPPVPWRPGGSGVDPVAEAELSGDPPAELSVIEPGFAHLTPRVVPGHHRSGLRSLATRQVRRALRQAVADLGSPRVRAVIVPTLDRYLGACDEGTRIFYVSDAFIAGTDHSGSAAGLERAVRRQAADADLVVAASPALAEQLARFGIESLLLPNGCDAELFGASDRAMPAEDVWLAPPIAGYIGNLSSRIDVGHLVAVAARGHSLLLVGPGPRGSLDSELRALLQRPNVLWVGPRSFAELPSYLHHIDVGVVPYADTPYNHVSFPLQPLEYLAAGKPVVSTPIGSMTWLLEQSRPGLTAGDLSLVADPEATADRVEKLFVVGPDPDATSRRQAAAANHSWPARARVLDHEIGHPSDTNRAMETATP